MAQANGVGVEATASATGVVQTVNVDGLAAAVVSNQGTFFVAASAFASGTDAQADAAAGAVQQWANGSAASALLVNNGALSAVADAGASGQSAGAWAFGVLQEASGSVSAVARLNNGGVVNLTASAIAVGGTDVGAWASATGIEQEAWAGDALADIDNDGTVLVQARALASGGPFADAEAWALGISQAAGEFNTLPGTALATISNAGTIDVGALALAEASGPGARASAEADGYGIRQDVLAGVGTAAIFNVGLLNVQATASAVAVPGTVSGTAVTMALASASAYGVVQEINAASSGLALFTNAVTKVGAGEIDLLALALASGSSARAHAFGIGVQQSVEGGLFSGTASLLNAGVINVGGAARASGPGAEASATALGASQTVNVDGFAMAAISNVGTVAVSAAAFATGTAAEGDAEAGALEQWANGSAAQALIVNNGVVSVLADGGVSDGSGGAWAFGIQQEAYGTASAVATISNNGVVKVGASAEAVGGPDVAAWASATGLEQEAWGADATAQINNRGAIQLEALAVAMGEPFADANVWALGIDQGAGEFSTLPGTALATISNAGTIEVDARAIAAATGPAANATASVDGYGIRQNVVAGIGTADVFNTGLINVHAIATAIVEPGDESATIVSAVQANASAYGVVQQIDAGSTGLALFTNAAVAKVGTGELHVLGLALASGPNASAHAFAVGVQQSVEGGKARSLRPEARLHRAPMCRRMPRRAPSGSGRTDRRPVHCSSITVCCRRSPMRVSRDSRQGCGRLASCRTPRAVPARWRSLSMLGS